MAVEFDPNALNAYTNQLNLDRLTEAGGISKKGKGAAAASGGSWLLELAVVMGKIADKMGENVVKLAKQIDSRQDAKAAFENVTGKSAGSFGLSELNAMLQANTQIMSNFMQAMSSAIKAIGEGENTIAKRG
jgi:hypothetical protein